MASLIRAAASAPRRVSASTRREFSAILTPSEEFPGIPSTSPVATSASSASVTTLPNGLTVVSENAASTSTIALTFPSAGSSAETSTESGAALANKYMSFKSGSGLSAAVILRNLEDDGATPFATASRTSATVGFTGAKDKAVRLIPLLATSCTYEKWDVKDAQKSAKIEADAANSCAQTVLTESVYSAAYGSHSGMGQSLYSTSASGSSIQSFRERTYGLNGAILAATGVEDHAAFVKAVEEGFSESPVGNGDKAPASSFMGGESRVHAPSSGYAHLALAFVGPEFSALSNVVKQCITLSSDGVSGFSDSTGLVGAYAGSTPTSGAAVADALCAAITVAPSADIVERAKKLAKADALFALDGGSQSLADAMTSSIIESGSFSAANIAASYDSITASDVAAAFDAMAKSTPAVAAVGDLSSTPYQGTLTAKFG